VPVSLDNFLSVLSETDFALIFPVSNENEDERCTLRFRLTLFSFLSETVFAHFFPFRTKPKNERRTLNTSTSLLPVVREY
jgi:hypothetical protein